MRLGDLVHIIPVLDDEPDRYEGLIGLIIEEVGHQMDETLFRLLVNGNAEWVMLESDLEVIDETG
jgi:hypothetical protein